MAKVTLPQRLVRDVERTLHERINAVKSKIAEHYEQCRAELGEVAETFGVEKEALFALAGVPKPEEKKGRRRRKKGPKIKTVVKKRVTARKKTKKKAAKKARAEKKSSVKKGSGGTAEEKVAGILKKKPAASAADISKATGYADKSVYATTAWKNRSRSK